MTTEKEGGAPTKTIADVSAKGDGSGSLEDPITSLVVHADEVSEWRQTALSEFPPNEQWFEDNIKTMDQAEAFGRVLLEIDRRNQLTLGLLFLHVEKHKGGRGFKGGKSELARRLSISRQNVYDCISYVEGVKKVSNSLTPLEELPLLHYKAIDKSLEPETTIEFIAETIEEKGKPPPLREVAAKNREITREKKLEQLSDVPEREEIVHDSIENILQYLKPNSVDLIVTDPPYPQEFLPLWESLAKKAAEILRPGGILLSYSGQANLPEVLALMTPHLKYMWTFALLQTGPHTIYFPSRVWINWKPLLFFVKPPYTPLHEWIRDPIKGHGREKEYHEWQQSLGEAEELITRFSRPGDLVVDPFLGSGTTVIAAQNTGRNFFGMDIDELAIKTTLGRLSR